MAAKVVMVAVPTVLGIASIRVYRVSEAPPDGGLTREKLSVYTPVPQSSQMHFLVEKPGFLESGLGTVRESLTPCVHAVQGACVSVKNGSVNLYHAGEDAYYFFKDPPSGFLPRMGIITMSGLLGMILARKGSRLTRSAVPLGMMGAGALGCYPAQTVAVLKVGGKKLYAAGQWSLATASPLFASKPKEPAAPVPQPDTVPKPESSIGTDTPPAPETSSNSHSPPQTEVLVETPPPPQESSAAAEEPASPVIAEETSATLSEPEQASPEPVAEVKPQHAALVAPEEPPISGQASTETTTEPDVISEVQPKSAVEPAVSVVEQPSSPTPPLTHTEDAPVKTTGPVVTSESEPGSAVSKSPEEPPVTEQAPVEATTETVAESVPAESPPASENLPASVSGEGPSSPLPSDPVVEESVSSLETSTLLEQAPVESTTETVIGSVSEELPALPAEPADPVLEESSAPAPPAAEQDLTETSKGGSGLHVDPALMDYGQSNPEDADLYSTRT